jgi:hypothetical protein
MFRFVSVIPKIRVGVGRWVPVLPTGARKYPPKSVKQNKNIPKQKKAPRKKEKLSVPREPVEPYWLP